MLRLILFDIDGTLIRTGGAGVRAFEKTFETVFAIRNGTSRLNFSGRTDPSLVRECLEAHGIPCSPTNFQRFYEVYVHWLQHFLEHLDGSPCPAVHEKLAELAASPQRALLGLLTGNIRLGAELKLRKYQLWPHFEMGAFGDDHEDRNCLAALAKERAESIRKGPIRGDEILVIGDTPLDVACGKSIGARTIAVATGGFSVEQLQSCQPDVVLPDLSLLDFSAFS